MKVTEVYRHGQHADHGKHASCVPPQHLGVEAASMRGSSLQAVQVKASLITHCTIHVLTLCDTIHRGCVVHTKSTSRPDRVVQHRAVSPVCISHRHHAWHALLVCTAFSAAHAGHSQRLDVEACLVPVWYSSPERMATTMVLIISSTQCH